MLDDTACIPKDQARVLCRLVAEAIEDLSADEATAWAALADECGFDEWNDQQIAASRQENASGT